MFNKYAIKCKNFIDQRTCKKNINISNIKFIESIKRSIQKTDIDYDYKLISSKITQILQKNDLPLIYQIYKKHFNNKMSFKQFYEWYKVNQIDLPSIVKYVDRKIHPSLLNMLYDNPFIPLKIVRFAEINSLIFDHITFQNLTINLFYTETKYRPNIDRIIHICQFVSDIFNKKLRLKLTILCAPNKKKLSHKYDYLLPDNCNTGSTLKGKFINLWRVEEIDKVLIHELIHYLYVDSYFLKNSLTFDKYVQKEYNIKGNSYTYECITEILAIIIHSVYISLKTKIILDRIIGYETNFSMFQTAKILSFFNFKSFDDIKTGEIKQKVGALSYYILKSSLLSSIDSTLDYIENIKKNNETTYFVTLLKKTMNDSKFIDCINYYMDRYKNNQKHNFIWNTMRMSCLQLI